MNKTLYSTATQIYMQKLCGLVVEFTSSVQGDNLKILNFKQMLPILLRFCLASIYWRPLVFLLVLTSESWDWLVYI